MSPHLYLFCNCEQLLFPLQTETLLFSSCRTLLLIVSHTHTRWPGCKDNIFEQLDLYSLDVTVVLEGLFAGGFTVKAPTIKP